MANEPYAPRGADVQKALRKMLEGHEEEPERQHQIVKRVAFLFRRSFVIPSIKHPSEIMLAVKTHLKRGVWLDNRKLFALVDGRLSKDRNSWDALSVWSKRRTSRNMGGMHAFSKPDEVLALMNFRYPEFKPKNTKKN